jgi:hypothetical protein
MVLAMAVERARMGWASCKRRTANEGLAPVAYPMMTAVRRAADEAKRRRED